MDELQPENTAPDFFFPGVTGTASAEARIPAKRARKLNQVPSATLDGPVAVDRKIIDKEHKGGDTSRYSIVADCNPMVSGYPTESKSRKVPASVNISLSGNGAAILEATLAAHTDGVVFPNTPKGMLYVTALAPTSAENEELSGLYSNEVEPYVKAPGPDFADSLIIAEESAEAKASEAKLTERLDVLADRRRARSTVEKFLDAWDKDGAIRTTMLAHVKNTLLGAISESDGFNSAVENILKVSLEHAEGLQAIDTSILMSASITEASAINLVPSVSVGVEFRDLIMEAK